MSTEQILKAKEIYGKVTQTAKHGSLVKGTTNVLLS